jgi:Flp pilus assembly protein TadD
MADKTKPRLPPPTPEQRKVASGQFERAKQVLAQNKDFDYAIKLLINCCKLDPANLIYRQQLRASEKVKYKDKGRGSALAFLSGDRTRLKAAVTTGKYREALEYGELALAKNPWDAAVQMDMAVAADALGLIDMAIWFLEQARQKTPNDGKLNRMLAKFYEKRGNFKNAIAVWDMLYRANPRDAEAHQKVKDLAAHDTIARGGYETAAEQAMKPATAGKSDGQEAQPVISQPAQDRGAQEVATLQARIEADATNFNTYVQLANVHRRAGRLEEARQVLQQGLGPTGNNFELTSGLAELDIEPFRRDLAIAENKLKAKPDDQELQAIRDKLAKEVNSRELELYRIRFDRYPTNKEFRFEYGVRLYRAGHSDGAISHFQALKTDPRHEGRALVYLGYCFKERGSGNWTLAKMNFEDALAKLPPGDDATRKELLYEIATGSAKAKDYPRAVEAGYELANMDFTYQDIGRLVEEWQKQLPDRAGDK